MSAPPGMVRKDFVLTNAGLAEFEACPATAVYVPTEEPETHFVMWYGIFVHRFLEYCMTRGYEGALEYIQGKRLQKAVRTCERIDPEALFYGQAEVGYCHDPFQDTSRRVSFAGMRSRDWRTEQFGKADIICTLDVPRPLIGDYKCTSSIDYEPRDSTQLMGLAASYRAETGCQEIDVSIAQVRSTGEIIWHIQTVDENDLNRYVDRARAVHLRVLDDRERADNGIVPEFVKGDQCVWCSLKKVCPRWK